MASVFYIFQVLLLFLVGVQNLQKRLVDVRLVGKATLYLVDVVDGMAEFHLALGIRRGIAWHV